MLSRGGEPVLIYSLGVDRKGRCPQCLDQTVKQPLGRTPSVRVGDL